MIPVGLQLQEEGGCSKNGKSCKQYRHTCFGRAVEKWTTGDQMHTAQRGAHIYRAQGL